MPFKPITHDGHSHDGHTLEATSSESVGMV